MEVSLLVRSHMWQRRYGTLIISPPNSHIFQVHFNLTDATHWQHNYNGFSYEEFYEFIIDFFEADTTPEAQEASAKLLGWWNKCVSNSIIACVTTDGECSQNGFSKVCGNTCGRT